ncbi:MAG: hypothetical protein JJU41_10780 [Bacteroidetes bacterium]|nr:hypothetical protein [Bacteroidota bacterium]
MIHPTIKSFLFSIPLLFIFFSCSSSSSDPVTADSIANQSYERLTPVLSFGEDTADADDIFFQQIVDFTRHPDGRFFLLDSGQKRVFVFGPSGNYINAFGREGRGPMEFENPFHIFTVSSTLYVYDIGSFSLKSFRESGPNNWEFIKSIDANPRFEGNTSTFPVRVQPVGENLFTSTYRQRFSPTNSGSDPAPFNLATINDNGDLQHVQSVTLPPTQMLMVQNNSMFMIRSQPLGYRIVDFNSPDGFYYAAHNSSNEFYRLDLSDADATPELWAQPTLPTHTNTPEEIARALDGLEGEMLSQARDGMPELRPFFDHFVVCDEGLLWIRHEPYSAETNETRYVVYDPAQEAFTRFVSFEGRVRINRIANREILARGHDEMGQFMVLVYPI